tara:strand:+ start:231 stop:383 length:153 start_codon:yes stop_codon:yes gene_type:complete
MIDNLRAILKEVTDLEKGLKRNGDTASLKKIVLIKKLIKSCIVQAMQKKV